MKLKNNDKISLARKNTGFHYVKKILKRLNKINGQYKFDQFFNIKTNPKVNIGTHKDLSYMLFIQGEYVFDQDEIYIYTFKNTIDNSEYLQQIYLHELIHSTKNKNKMNRNMAGHKEEIIAFFGAYILCQLCNITDKKIKRKAICVVKQELQNELLKKKNIKQLLKHSQNAVQYLVNQI